MGNCQAAETAAAVIQRPDGKTDRIYCTVSASQVLKSHPGHHVALLLSSAVPRGGSLRVTRIKLLRPSDNLLIGHVYRLVSYQEVMKGLRAKKSEKIKKIHGEFSVAEDEDNNNGFKINPLTLKSESSSHKEDTQRKKDEKQGSVMMMMMMNTGTGTGTGANKVRTWQPSLQSIAEST